MDKKKKGRDVMTVYQELQLSSAGSKNLIRRSENKEEKKRHIFIYNAKVYLVVAFCFAVVTAALLAVGCGGDKGGGEDEANYDGWMLTRWKDGTALTGTVYLQLGEDGIFSLYQSIGTFGYARFTGTYALVGDPATGQVLSGTYADGTPWDSSYAVEKMTKRELRLRALKDGVVSVYSGVAIPAAVKDGVTAGRLRSAAQGRSFL